MKKRTIKLALFSLVGFTALSALADDVALDELTLIEDLPVAQRNLAHSQVIKYLSANPEAAELIKFIAVDKEGNVYVLDEKQVDIISLGAPSCIDAGN
jgi:hypothetical protein